MFQSDICNRRGGGVGVGVGGGVGEGDEKLIDDMFDSVLLEATESVDGCVTCVFYKVQMGFQSNTTIYAIIRRSKPVVHILPHQFRGERKTNLFVFMISL